MGDKEELKIELIKWLTRWASLDDSQIETAQMELDNLLNTKG